MLFDPLSKIQEGTSHESRDSLGGWDLVLQSWTKSLPMTPLDVFNIRARLVAFLIENHNGGLFALRSEMDKDPLPLTLTGSDHKQFQVSGEAVSAVGMYFKACRSLRKRKNKFAADDAPVTELADVAYNPQKRFHNGFKDAQLGEFVKRALLHTAWSTWTNSEKAKQTTFDATHALKLCRSYIGNMFMAKNWLKNPDVWNLRQSLGDMVYHSTGGEGSWPYFLNGAVAPKHKGKGKASANQDAQDDPHTKWIANNIVDNKKAADQKKLQKILDLVQQVGGVKNEKGKLVVSETVRDLAQGLVTVRVKLNQSNSTSLTFIILGTCT